MNKVKTFLNPANDNLRYNESIIDGIKHEQRQVWENQKDGFFFEECEQRESIHSLGTVYVFDDGSNVWGYICTGYAWYRFNLCELEQTLN